MKNKQLKIILVLCCFPLMLSAQIETVQYWFDNDFAGRTTQQVTPVAALRISELNTADLSSGLHIVHIRVKDNSNWSVVQSQLFYKLPPYFESVEMATYEYWVDANFAEKQQGTFNGKTGIINELNLSSLNDGLHTLHLRALDDLGRASVHSQLFYKVSEPDKTKMVSYEYWIDADFAEKQQGTFNGKMGVINELSFPSLSNGLHVLHIRAFDDSGQVSVVHSQPFYKINEPAGNKMVSYEYWVDANFTEKQQGTFSEKTGVISELDFSSLSEGLHMLHVRAFDDLGRAGTVYSRLFYKVSKSADNQMAAYEYWIDDDFAERTQETATGKIITIKSLFADNEITTGLHTISIRAKDTAGRWSAVHTQGFYKHDAIVEGENKIAAYQYWYDDDFADIQYISLETPANPYELDDQFSVPENFEEGEEHTIHIQFRDLLGQWSVVETDTFKIAIEEMTVDIPTVTDGTEITVYTVEKVIAVENAEGNAITITDINGRILFTKTNARSVENFRISHRGVYVVLVDRKAYKVLVD